MKQEESSTKDTKLLFRQAYDYIVTRIELGEWQTHDKLPSIRMLAQELRIHRLTVFRAYQMLKQNGKAYVKEKSGYYVSPGNTQQVISEHPESHPVTSSGFLKNSLAEIQQVPVVYQFSQALIDPNLLPNLYLSEYVKQVFDDYPKLMGTYSNVQGDEELCEFLCRYMKESHNLQLSVSDLLVTTGGQQAIDLISRVYIRPMDPILVERPTYSSALDIFRQQGARIIPVDITLGGYDLEKVEMLMIQHRPRIFYMNPTFHNPTGYTVPKAQRKQLVELAERYHCLLVEDDAIHEMYFDEPPPEPMLTYDTNGWVVYIRSFSKYVAPGLRICVVIGRPSVITPLLTAKSLADNGTPLVNQKLFLHYFESERMRQHLKKLRIALQVRKEIVEEELKTTGWTWDSPKGGFNLWLKLPETLPVEGFLNECMEQSISFIPGIICDPLREMRSWIRLSYSFINEEHLRSGVRRLANIAERYSVR
ncbi:GntR family transcriptional regulator [Paenibacillus baekrokdamisoli]|uniref:GntR family transcriptional regulator n=1 Tax=Paenibacillus baekrokdamisoli TaxID=1712516 RepID=A0A3G9JG29_9BACL|nr:PLP-dependent aminotransferase family protein [Paenibacillus baekrokdamisoli]MBB3072278.1 DNA-binding transcriptional MocR family regulator [Paenibacillus baekrokdamisoli]BBH24861.1 GntR family transcriptional regulator [Paenibacillus baekrokdamisoli]